jgi:hypothetical protein
MIFAANESEKDDSPNWFPLYAAPVPSPDSQDAARYRAARALLASQQAAKIFALASPDEIDAAIDAAMRGEK